MSTQTERTAAHAAFVARNVFIAALRTKHGFTTDDLALAGGDVTAFFAELAAYDAADVKPGAPSPLTSVIQFTAFNKQTQARESFSCTYTQGHHKDAMDAATDKLWYGEFWNREQLEAADVRLEEVAPVETVADINDMTVAQLRDTGHCVIVWTPEEIGGADIDDLESVCTERGHSYIESF